MQKLEELQLNLGLLNIEVLDIIFVLINLLVLFLLYKFLLHDRVKNILQERQDAVKADYEKAAKARKKAKRTKRRYEASLADAREEAAQIIETAKGRGEAEYNRIVGEADERARKIIADAQVLIEQERASALSDVQAQINELAMIAALKILGESSNADTDSSLYDSFIAKTGGANDANSH